MGRPEYDEVERPLIEQLVAMGWAHLEGAPPGHHPTDARLSGRQDFETVVLEDRFRAAVDAINPGPDGSPWLLKEGRLDRIVDVVLDRSTPGLPGNLAFTGRLRTGVTVEGLPGWEYGVNQDIRLIDFEHPERNDLLVVSQFRIDRPERTPVIPDLVLFVNGLPLVVIECKRPGPQALDDAVDQVLGYAGSHEEAPVPELVHFAQLLIATSREAAQLATPTAEPRHFASWRTVEPATPADVRRELGKPDHHALLPQELLVAGVLRPAHLLSLVRDFMVTGGSGVSVAKVVARWQQFRAVHRLIGALRQRYKIGRDQAPYDHRAGVVWHTQGSGKSLTMAFLVRCLRTDAVLAGHKVVVVTDRVDLQSQIGGSLAASDETVHRARDVDSARDYLAQQTSDLVMVMIQKAQQDEAASEDEETEDGATVEREPTDEELNVSDSALNPNPSIVVLVDEAHRSQDGVLHARLRKMLPNAAMVGFTGTPIIKGRKKRTDEIFGEVVDAYTLQDAIDDRSVVPVRYEARLPKFAVVRKAVLDEEFDQLIGGTRSQRRRAMRRLARKREVLEAEHVIAYKAQDMFMHWVRTAMPEGFGAQIVAVSRKAAVRYRDAILAARDRLVAQLDAVDGDLRHDPMAHETASKEERVLLELLDSRDLLDSIDAAVVISESDRSKDPDTWRSWTRWGAQRDHIRRFKQGIGPEDRTETGEPWQATTHGGPIGMPSGAFSTEGDPWDLEPDDGKAAETSNVGEDESGPLAFLMVKSMLLTGFDAPVEQVLYLDRGMGGVELLQAMARTNRPYRNKEHGLVVDYVGVYRDMRRALGDYEQEHLRQVIGGDEAPARTVWKGFNESEVPNLRAQHQRVVDLVTGCGLAGVDTPDQREDLLAELSDPVLRARFDDRVRDFLSALNAVLPRPQGLPYVRFAKQVGEIQYLARSRYRDGRSDFSPRRYGAKVRALIDQHLELKSIEQRTPPLDITAADYLDKLALLRDDRARALDMASGLKVRIDVKLPKAADQGHYEHLSERLTRITQTMERDFEEAARDLLGLVQEERTAAAEEQHAGPEHFTVGPVRTRLEQALVDAGLSADELDLDVDWAARSIADRLAVEAAVSHFTESAVVQEMAIRKLISYLENDLGLWDANTESIATDLVDLAVRRVDDFRRWGGPQRH
ncbi:type I restriction endonuclease subunit R [Streptomyces sp. SHP 1-2]|uniref:type I restriction endonuclease subunit R n=1 Tax=Streptomyces sp. SHP 1-2 TaxID=2769489 RepID=UPI0022384F5C|nr:HsdR family type I site-specific deoxyribonuclease [Streptomyces sp. SHP 1-2]MCW5250519.1 type I restriction endonuclease subunit R [Streptomyces sp. SHP 1-2]